jgi:hypothetical protein
MAHEHEQEPVNYDAPHDETRAEADNVKSGTVLLLVVVTVASLIVVIIGIMQFFDVSAREEIDTKLLSPPSTALRELRALEKERQEPDWKINDPSDRRSARLRLEWMRSEVPEIQRNRKQRRADGVHSGVAVVVVLHIAVTDPVAPLTAGVMLVIFIMLSRIAKRAEVTGDVGG